MINKIFAVVKKELKDLFREKRTIIMTIVLPAVVIPLIFIFITSVQSSTIKKHQEPVTSVVIETNDSITKYYVEKLKEMGVIKNYIESKNIEETIRNKEAEIGIKIISTDQSIEINVFYNAEREKPRSIAGNITKLIREIYITDTLEKAGLPPINTMIKEKQIPIGDATLVLRKIMAGLLGLILVLYSLIANAYLGADIGAGEKERGTLLPLLASPSNRKAIAIGKWIALTITNLISTTAIIFGQVIGVGYMIQKMLSETSDNVIKNFQLTDMFNAQTIGIVLFSVLILILFSAAFQLIISMWSKTIREAQLYLSQFSLPFMIPILVIYFIVISKGQLPLWTFFIPLINTMSIVYAGLMNTLTIRHALIALGMNIIIASIVIAIVVKLLDMEKIILRT